MRTPVGRTLALRELLDRMSANATRLSRALVYVELLAEVAGVAVGSDVVPQRGAASFDRHRQRRPDGAHQARAFLPGERSRLSPGADTRPEQRLAGVDVSHAYDQPGIHDELLDSQCAPAS